MKKFFWSLLLFAQLLPAQNQAEDNLGVWFTYNGTNRILDRWSVHTETQIRLYETHTNYNQFLLRTGLNYHIDSKMQLSLGYAFLNTDTSFENVPDEINSNENRIWQQFALAHPIWKFNTRHRFRFEQRFLNFGEEYDGGQYQTVYRMRYQIGLVYHVAPWLNALLSDEVLLNIGDDLFDQNRLFMGVAVPIAPRCHLRTGYLVIFYSTNIRQRLLLGVTYSPDLRKDKS